MFVCSLSLISFKKAKDILLGAEGHDCSPLVKNISKEKKDEEVVVGDGKSLRLKCKRIIFEKTTLKEEEKEEGKISKDDKKVSKE